MLNELVEKTNKLMAETGYKLAGCAQKIAESLTNAQAAELLSETGVRRYIKMAEKLNAPDFVDSRLFSRANVNDTINSIIVAKITG